MLTEVLGLPQEVQKQHVSKSGLGGPAVTVGEDRPWRLHHGHHGSSLLIFPVVHLWVLKNLTWGFLGGSVTGCVTRLVCKEEAFAAPMSCQPSAVVLPRLLVHAT